MAYHHHLCTSHYPGRLRVGVMLLAALVLVILSGCTRQQVYANLYEGIRVRNELQIPPPERGAQQNQQDYRQYQRHIIEQNRESDNP